MILLSKTKKLTKNRVDQVTPKKTKNSKMVSNLGVVSFSLKGFGSLYVSGKLPTYPSSKPIFCPKWEESVNVELGQGSVVSFPETCCGWVQLSNDVLQKIEKILNPTTTPHHITYHRKCLRNTKKHGRLIVIRYSFSRFFSCAWKWDSNNPWSYEYMKIIYENCGVKNYMKEDHCSYWRNFCSCEKKAWKNAGLYQTRLNPWLRFYRCIAPLLSRCILNLRKF